MNIVMKRFVLIILLLIYSALIIFLSFQSGPDTADTSMRFTKFILHLFIRGDIPYEVLEHWHMTFRLLAHPLIFCLFSILAMGVARQFLKRRWVCFLITSVVGILLSIVTEVGKWNIPGRHMDFAEMGWNVLGVIGGLLLYVVAGKLYGLLKDKRYRIDNK